MLPLHLVLPRLPEGSHQERWRSQAPLPSKQPRDTLSHPQSISMPTPQIEITQSSAVSRVSARGTGRQLRAERKNARVKASLPSRVHALTQPHLSAGRA
jgi:hypothetical protein